MPYDDSNIKKMIKHQTERKVGFSRSKKVPELCKNLIHRLLEANVKKRATIPEILSHPWLKPEVENNSDQALESLSHNNTRSRSTSSPTKRTDASVGGGGPYVNGAVKTEIMTMPENANGAAELQQQRTVGTGQNGTTVSPTVPLSEIPDPQQQDNLILNNDVKGIALS